MSLFWCISLTLSAVAFTGITYYTAKHDGFLTVGSVLATLLVSLIPFFNIWLILYMIWEEWIPKILPCISKVTDIKIWKRKK